MRGYWATGPKTKTNCECEPDAPVEPRRTSPRPKPGSSIHHGWKRISARSRPGAGRQTGTGAGRPKEKNSHETPADQSDGVWDADLLAREISLKGGFNDVGREVGEVDEATLLVGGSIHRFEKGSQAARLLVGMGAGSAYFDVSVEFREAASGSLLATMLVDKNSWPLGGMIAAAQSPQAFMQEAAKRVAKELDGVKTVSKAK